VNIRKNKTNWNLLLTGKGIIFRRRWRGVCVGLVRLQCLYGMSVLWMLIAKLWGSCVQDAVVLTMYMYSVLDVKLWKWLVCASDMVPCEAMCMWKDVCCSRPCVPYNPERAHEALCCTGNLWLYDLGSCNGRRSLSWLSYTLSKIIWIVPSTGTFVNKLSTSIDANIPVGWFVLRMSTNSSMDLRLWPVGIYGCRMSFSLFGSLYVGVITCDMIGLNGLFCLWVLTFPYA